MNVLFVCNQGTHRSKTAAELYSKDQVTRSTGVYTDLEKKNLGWADVMVVMEEHQRAFIAQRFPDVYLQKRTVLHGYS